MDSRPRQNPAYPPATEKALETGLFLCLPIRRLARGESNAIKPRKTEISLAPANMDLPCRCGHIFGHHGWRAVRRRVRLRRRHAKFKDVALSAGAATAEGSAYRRTRLAKLNHSVLAPDGVD
jgi:hypothetical protein